MNKSVLSHVAVFAIGAGLGFLVTKKLLEEHYAELAQEEIDSVKEMFLRTHTVKTETLDADGREYYSKNEYQENGTTEEEYDEKRSNPSGVMARSSLSVKAVKSEQVKQNYHLIKKTEDDEDEPEETAPEEDGQEEMDLEGIDRTVPYLIDDREYSEEFEHHEKVSLYYYTFDAVLCNENEEPVEDVDELVGQDCMDALASGEMCVWVRNEPLGIDYEICAVRNSYSQAVHGINLNENLSPRERYLKQQKRRESSDE